MGDVVQRSTAGGDADETAQLHLQRIQIPTTQLSRWRDIAHHLEMDGLALMVELRGLEQDPSLHNLRRAAKAARIIERVARGNNREIVGSVASEIEQTVADTAQLGSVGSSPVEQGGDDVRAVLAVSPVDD